MKYNTFLPISCLYHYSTCNLYFSVQMYINLYLFVTRQNSILIYHRILCGNHSFPQRNINSNLHFLFFYFFVHNDSRKHSMGYNGFQEISITCKMFYCFLSSVHIIHCDRNNVLIIAIHCTIFSLYQLF
jgi:hypothetical protein